jgi:alpha-N-arabinofuranosidase
MFASCLGSSTLESSVSGAGEKFFYSVTGSPDKVCIKLVNASSAEQALTITLNGLGDGSHTVQIETMKANTTWATNTITQPDRIVPVRSTMNVQGGSIQYERMPAYSIQVLQIDRK